MAKIVQSLTRASEEYNADVSHSLVRDLDAVLEKLNSTFQEDLKQEIEARSFSNTASKSLTKECDTSALYSSLARVND